MTKEILEGNMLIAEFMGIYKHKNLDILVVPKALKLQLAVYKINESKLKFHTSWDWLMPVVQKISDLYGDKGICQPNGLIYECAIFAHIESVWKAVLEFIKWYNSQKEPNP